MTKLNNHDVKKLRIINTADELPENAKYYARTTTMHGRFGESYYRLFNADFEEIECVTAPYTNVLDGLTLVSDESDKNDYHSSWMVYKLTNRNDKGFWICEKIDYTAPMPEDN